jgi:hypothetical protein
MAQQNRENPQLNQDAEASDAIERNPPLQEYAHTREGVKRAGSGS